MIGAVKDRDERLVSLAVGSHVFVHQEIKRFSRIYMVGGSRKLFISNRFNGRFGGD